MIFKRDPEAMKKRQNYILFAAFLMPLPIIIGTIPGFNTDDIYVQIVVALVAYGSVFTGFLIQKFSPSEKLKKILNSELDIKKENLTVIYSESADCVPYGRMKNLTIIISADGIDRQIKFEYENKLFLLNKFENMKKAAALVEKYAGKKNIRKIKQVLPWNDSVFIYSGLIIIFSFITLYVYLFEYYGITRIGLAIMVFFTCVLALLQKKKNWG